LVFVLAGLTLLWPLLGGQIMFGGLRSDMLIAGYSFRLFGATEFLANGAIPQWNPYLYGGLPYIAAMHGDIFYPTAWLRWILPVDLAITWGMVFHFILAGWCTWVLARSLRLSWTAATIAGISYQLSGIVASQISPGHEGKLFVSALTPLALWLLVRAVRDRRGWAFGALSLVIALVTLGHYHMAYFLFIGLGLWTLYLTFWDPDRPAGRHPLPVLGLALLAVLLGVGITALQVLPFLEYIPWSPRAGGGPDTGWEWVNTYALPPAEVLGWILPEFHGLLDHYWGSNPIKFHTEYLGVMPLALATFAWGDRARRRLVVALLSGGLLFLVIAFAGHTPLFRPFYELLPMLNKLRAMGMVFYLVAFPLALLAGIGLDRILTGQVAPRRVLAVFGGFLGFALLGMAGVLQSVAEALADPARFAGVVANADHLRSGALRLLVVTLVSGAAVWLVAANRVRGMVAAGLLAAAASADLWSVNRQFFIFSPRAAELFRDDEITAYLRAQPMPYRVLDVGAYPYATLMAWRIPVVLGYHGHELRAYQELGGRHEGWRNVFSPNLLDLLATRYLILQEAEEVPGLRRIAGPITSTFGSLAVLYEQEDPPPYARVLPVSAKLPADQVIPTVLDPRFPTDRVILYHDTTSVAVAPLPDPLPSSPISATVAEWAPGSMRITLEGTATAPSYLLVSENWYPDWHATVDGQSAVVHRANHTLLSVVLPPGAREVMLRFDSRSYRTGKLVSLVSLLLTVGLVAAGRGLPV
jgi:hypothetical protein